MKKEKADYEEDWLDDSSTPSFAPLFRMPYCNTVCMM